MAYSFGVVEEKLQEAEFFLHHLRQSATHSIDARFFFSAFVSAARSVTLAMQASLHTVAGFDEWYKGVQQMLKADLLAPYFVEIRNDVIHKGINPLNQVTVEHLQEHLSMQFRQRDRSHVLLVPSLGESDATVLADADTACSSYLKSLVAVVFECYSRFRTVVDPQWYFTEENFVVMGRTLRDAVVELGFPAEWADCAPDGQAAWRVLRRQQPPCAINDLFDHYLGKTILSPDQPTKEREGR